MIRFFYKAKTRNDPTAKTITGLIEALNLNQAVGILKKKGLIPISISPTKQSIFKEILAKFFNKVSLGEIATFTRNLSTMVTAGLPLTNALTLLKAQSSEKMAPVLEDILHSVESGGNLSEALARHPDIFSKVYVSLVKAGESAGVLDKVLQRLADTLEKQKEFQAKLKGAMIYPIIIVVGMLGVALAMMVMVIPKLLGLYKDFGAELPGPTKVLIGISDFIIGYFPLLILLAFGGFYGFIALKKRPNVKRKLDSLKLKIPVFGHLQKLIVLTEVTRTLGLLVGSGVQIIDALNIVAGASSNMVFEEGIRSAAKQVEKGFPLAKALEADGNFPPIVPQLISIGEETGKMDEVLSKISHFFEMESDETLKGLTTAIEPLIMIVLGIGVGFLIVAIILPIYNLTAQF